MVTRVNVDGYNYSYDSNTEKLVLTEYTDNVANILTPVIESVDFYRLTIVPTPADATVTLSAEGYQTVTGTGTQYIDVETGTSVHYIVSKTGYDSRSGDYIVQSDQSYSINLTIDVYTFTVTPNPINANVTLSAQGYPTVTGTGTQSISVPYDTNVTVSITLLTYKPYQALYNITSNESIIINLRRLMSMGMVYNYGRCVICLMNGERILDLGQVAEQHAGEWDYGYVYEAKDDKLDNGEL